MLWAAAWLYKAGGGNDYLNYALNNQGWSEVPSEFSWDNKFAGAQTLLAKVNPLYEINIILFVSIACANKILN